MDSREEINRISDVIYKYTHVTHDGYDRYGPKSNLYDYYTYTCEYGDYKVTIFHNEEWFDGSYCPDEKTDEQYLSNINSLESLVSLFKFCYDKSNNDKFKLAYQQKYQEMNALENQPQTHIKRRLAAVKSPMLNRLYNDVKFLYFFQNSTTGSQYTKNHSHWIYTIHTIIKDKDDFVCIWYTKEKINFNNTEYVESNRVRLSEITTLESLRDNFNIKYIMNPYYIRYIDNPEFIIAYENKISQLLV
jgi:hypothetical protein